VIPFRAGWKRAAARLSGGRGALEHIVAAEWVAMLAAPINRWRLRSANRSAI
jgi:hypothetical protein